MENPKCPYCADGLADFRCKTNDSDLVYRGEVRRILQDQKVVHKERAVNRLTAVKPVVRGEVEHIESIPPVKQPMSAAEYIHTSNRMLKEDYRARDRLMVFEENDDSDKAITWMEEWMREHPKEANDER